MSILRPPQKTTQALAIRPRFEARLTAPLDHLLDKSVDLVLAVTALTTLLEVHHLLSLESAGRVRQLEGPEEVGGLLEMRADGGDFVDKVFNADDAVFAEVGLDDFVGSDGDALAGNLGETALVDEIADRLDGGVTGNDERKRGV